MPAPQVSVTSDQHADWQTYTDTVRGFSLKYPADAPVDITSSPVELPPAVGGKERQLKIEVMPIGKTEVDSDGCLKWNFSPVPKEKLKINNIPLCLTIVGEGAAGSIYQTYHYTMQKNDLVIDITMTVRFPTTVRVYAGCEEDSDQTTQKCIDLAFDEERDTALFKEIIDTLQDF